MDGRLILALGALLLLPGCTLQPRYARPAPPVPEALPPGGGDRAGACPWEEVFTDPGLRSVIELALRNNRDLRVAALNVEKAQALYRIQRSNLGPTMGVMATGDKYRSPERVDSELYGTGKAMVIEEDTVQFGVMSWELDFFGKLRSLKDEALYQYLATEQAREAERISLVATVAQGYLTCAADRESLQLARSTFETQKTYHELVGKSFEAGIASELDLRQAQSQMDAARTDMARAGAQAQVDLNALELLVGAPVPAEARPGALDAVGDIKDVQAGLASSVLLRRPDIRMTEFQLKAANADIGAARAAFFPSISLTGGIGTMSPDVAHLFASGTRTWSFTPQILAPIFTGGSLWSNLKVSKTNRDIAVAQYEKAIQTAFREVADGLAQRAGYVEQVDAQRSLVQALETTYRLYDLRYHAGLDGYLGVLVAQHSLYNAQQNLISVRLAQRLNQIALYKALAGQMETRPETGKPKA
jgi:multidrug efflux system outer membrane protein